MSEERLKRVQELALARADRHLKELKSLIDSEGPAVAVAVFASACADVAGAALATHNDPDVRDGGQLGFALALNLAVDKYRIQYEALEAIEKAMS
tara:strand:- start:74 stop:358 length:285 start_codon:yes stop_codon:yes gene_type:complete